MSSTIKTYGMILKISDTPGKDKLLRILTSDGLVSAFMTPKRNAGKKNYTIDLFTYGEIVLFKTDSGNYLVNSVLPEEIFYKIREDIVRLAAASYFASLVINSANEPDVDCHHLLELLYVCFDKLSSGYNVKSLKAVFELKFSQLIGVEPCLVAEKKSNAYCFDIQDGRLYVRDVPNGFCLSRESVFSIYTILKRSVKECFDCEIVGVDDVSQISENYIMYHTERAFDSLEFLKGVM